MNGTITPPFSVVVQEIDALENTETQHGHLMALMRHRAMLAAAPKSPTAEKSSGVEQPQTVTDCHQSQPQVEQEPVASIYIADNGEREFDDWRHDLPVGRNYLYTHPQNLNCKSTQARLATLWGYEKPQPQREPLTEEEIAYCIFEARLGAEGAFKRNGSSSYRIARAIERAHGIGGEA